MTAHERKTPIANLHPQAREVLYALAALLKERPKIPPTWREIGAKVGGLPVGVVARRIGELKDGGWVTYEPHSPRTIQLIRPVPRRRA